MLSGGFLQNAFLQVDQAMDIYEYFKTYFQISCQKLLHHFSFSKQMINSTFYPESSELLAPSVFKMYFNYFTYFNVFYLFFIFFVMYLF